MDDDNLPPTGGDTPEPPPFQPDPELIAHFERGGKPSEAEVREMADRVRSRSAGVQKD